MNTLSDMASEQETVVKHIPSYLLAYTSLVLYGKARCTVCAPLNPAEIDGDFGRHPLIHSLTHFYSHTQQMRALFPYSS